MLVRRYSRGLLKCHVYNFSQWWLLCLLSLLHRRRVLSALACIGLAASTMSMHVCLLMCITILRASPFFVTISHYSSVLFCSHIICTHMHCVNRPLFSLSQHWCCMLWGKCELKINILLQSRNAEGRHDAYLSAMFQSVSDAWPEFCQTFFITGAKFYHYTLSLFTGEDRWNKLNTSKCRRMQYCVISSVYLQCFKKVWCRTFAITSPIVNGFWKCFTVGNRNELSTKQI